MVAFVSDCVPQHAAWTVQQYACFAQHVGPAEAAVLTLPAGTKETANRTAENTVANILETPRLMAQPTSTCTDWETETSSFFELGLTSQVEAEPTAKSEDERVVQSGSWSGQEKPLGRGQPIQASKRSARSRCDPNHVVSVHRQTFAAATRRSSHTKPLRGIRATIRRHSNCARPAAIGSKHEGKASRRAILPELPARTPTAPRLLQKQQTVERLSWCGGGS